MSGHGSQPGNGTSHTARGEAGYGSGRIGNRVEGAGWIGTVVQVGAVHGDVRLHSPAPAAPQPPMMLPAPPVRLRDRHHERARLNIAAARHLSPGQPTGWLSSQPGDRPLGPEVRGDRDGPGSGALRPDLLVISGPGGAGTTALALHLAHRAVRASAAPGGALWADLSAHHPDPGSDPVAGAVAGWLRALHADRVPEHGEEATALLRSLTADRPVVAVVEQATTAGQVRALLPAAGLVVVTSRHQLLDLAAVDGACRVAVGPLPAPDAAALAADIIGDRATSDPDGVRALVNACGALPAALVAAAAYVAARPHRPITDLAVRLTRTTRSAQPALSAARLSEEETVINSTLDAIYNGLDPALQNAYQYLATLPGPAFSAAAAAAALRTDDQATDTTLARLHNAHLLEYGPGPEQWRMPAPVRVHAEHLAESLPEEDRAAALARAVRHYLMWAAGLETVIGHGRRRYAPVFAWEPGRAPAVAGDQEAIALVQEWVPTLLAAQSAAAAHAMHHAAWQFVDALWGYLIQRQDYPAWRRVCQIGLDSAQRIQDAGAQARAHMLTGVLDRRLGRLAEASEHHTKTRLLARRAGDLLTEASAAEHHGATLLDLGRPQQALTVLHAGLALYQTLPTHPRGQALLQRQLGIAHSRLGHHIDAETHLTAAEALFTDLDESYLRSRLATNRAETALANGRFTDALAHLDRAMEILPNRAVPYDAYLHYLGAAIPTRAGDHDAAVHALNTAIAFSDQLPRDHPTR
ncbi:tetratricopeptide repeat protein, partial [Actinomadura sp. 7K507]